MSNSDKKGRQLKDLGEACQHNAKPQGLGKIMSCSARKVM